MATDETVVEGVAGRYAAALFDLAKDTAKLPEVEADLVKFAAMMADSTDLVRLVRSPVISAEDQAKALSVILAKSGISGLSANFFGLLASNRRLFAVGDIIKAFRMLAAKGRGEVTANVTSASALTAEQITDLKQTLKASVGKDVTLNTHVDPSLLGGLIVKVGSRMVDSSLKTKLQTLKTTLSGGGA